MKIVSLFGLVTLLGIAWIMSYHRKDIKYRTVIWGLVLQLDFAFIILQKNVWSFVGMAFLAMLITLFIFRDKDVEGFQISNQWLTLLYGIIAGIASYFITLYLPYGILIFLVIAFLILNSYVMKKEKWSAFAAAALVLLTFGHLVSHNLYGQIIFKSFSDSIAQFLSLSDYGAQFLFGNLADGKYYFPGVDTWPGFGFQFAFKVLPTIVFFGAFMSILYYLGLMQKVIQGMARFMRWTMGTSGAETMSCSANIFVGQTEAPLLIKPFIKDMTDSELLTIMVGGFATIAGGVLAGYIAMGVDAGHLVAASVMSAPAALVIGKIILPEKEHSVTAGDVDIPELARAENVIDAASTGITDGLKLAVNVGAMLLGFIALIAVIDLFLGWLDLLIDGNLLKGTYVAYDINSGLSPVTGEYGGIFPGSLKTLFGTLLRPLAFLMGVPWENADEVGNLLGQKLSLNEFVAYGTLGSYIQNSVLSVRAETISIYALCGFANFSSIGIQIGGISALAPEQRPRLSKLALKAMFGGAIASWITATIAGLLL